MSESLRVLVAARLSKKHRNGREGIGLDTQDDKSQEWAKREGHVVLAVVADTRSGTVAPWDRKNLRPWVTDPGRMAQYDAIVAFKNDRLSRGCWSDEVRIRLWAEEHGKRLIIVDGPQWPPRHDGDKWSWEAQADQARKEWEAGRERSMRAQAELRSQGKMVGRAPWGYAVTGDEYDKRMVPTAAGQKYVPEVFTRIADGHSLAEVAGWLSDVTGRSVHPRTVGELVRNPSYRGEYRARRYDADGRWTGEYGATLHQCPALVSGDLWRRAGAALDARPSSRRGQRADLDKLAAGAALLSGVSWCGNPECTATGRDAGPSPMCKSGQYYRCTGRGRARRGCGYMVPVAEVDRLMNDAMAGILAPVLRPVFHPATGHQVELDDVAQALRDLPARGLDEDAEDAERARLRAERRRLSDLPARPAWTEYVPTGQTYGDKWLKADQAERRTWLRDADFSLYVCKPADIDAHIIPPAPGDSLSRSDVHESKRAGLVFVWAGDEDPGMARGVSTDLAEMAA